MSYDHRDFASYQDGLFESIDERRMLGRLFEGTCVPIVFEKCHVCEGKGTHVNPNIDRNGITTEEMYERGDEFIEDYANGVYDVPCNLCKGKRVIPVPASEEGKKIAEEWEDSAAEDYAVHRAECWYMYR